MEKNRVYKMAIAELESYPYDMQDGLSNDEIAKAVSELIDAFRPKDGIIYNEAEVKLADLKVKAHNARNGSWLSVSDSEATGVSRSLVYMVNPHSKRVNLEDVTYTLDMINEAWYTLKN